MAGRGASAEVRQAAAERRRQVMQLRLSGSTFEAIGKHVGLQPAPRLSASSAMNISCV